MQKLTQQRILRTYQTDRFGNIRPLMLMNELQSVADDHAEKLGAGRTYCIEHGLAWVVTHYLVDIIEMPREGMELIFITWPSAHDSLKAVRDFEIRAADGRLLVRATSQWILISQDTRRPLRITEHLQNWKIIPERAYDRAFEKFPDFEPQKTHIFKCRYDDIDVNQHINNSVYAVWATESVGFDFRNTHTLRKLEINFKKEIAPDMPQVTVDVMFETHTTAEQTDTDVTAPERGIITHHKIRTGDTDNAYIICEWD